MTTPQKRPKADSEPFGPGIDLANIDSHVTCPVSMRVPLYLAYQLQLYTERMNTSTGKLMTSILEDVLPAFTKKDDFTVTLRVPQVYRAMENSNLLQSVNTADLKEKILKRGEGPIGRPRKGKKQQGDANG